MTRTASAPSTVDPISTSVIQGGLQSIAVEMGYKLMRMSCSSIIRESEDFGAAPTDAQGRRIAESMQSTPLQSGPVAGYAQNVLKVMAERGETILSSLRVINFRKIMALPYLQCRAKPELILKR